MTYGSERKTHKLLAERDAISTGRLIGGSTSLIHVIGVKGTIFNVLLLVVSSVWVGYQGDKEEG